MFFAIPFSITFFSYLKTHSHTHRRRGGKFEDFLFEDFPRLKEEIATFSRSCEAYSTQARRFARQIEAKLKPSSSFSFIDWRTKVHEFFICTRKAQFSLASANLRATVKVSRAAARSSSSGSNGLSPRLHSASSDVYLSKIGGWMGAFFTSNSKNLDHSTFARQRAPRKSPIRVRINQPEDNCESICLVRAKTAPTSPSTMKATRGKS
jgi:hypothetical protein